MSFENSFENNERIPTPRLTLEEFEEIRNVSREVAHSPEFKQRLEDLGIPFDTTEQELKIMVEGHELSIVNKLDDFGTVSLAPGNAESIKALEELGLKTGAGQEVEAWLEPVDPKLLSEIEAEERAQNAQRKIVATIKNYFGIR